MKESKHTPGPWNSEGWEGLVVNCATGETMCLAAGRKGADLEELKANARLIAAAPELLEALQDCVNALTDETGNVARREADASIKAREAIAKAKGGDK